MKPGRQLLRRELMSVLKSLTPREERVITLRFGLDDGPAPHSGRAGKGVQRHAGAHPPDRGKSPPQAPPSQPGQSGCGIIWNKAPEGAPHARRVPLSAAPRHASRANLYKMHKGVFGENVQNSKSNSQKCTKRTREPGVPQKRGLDKNIGPKWEKWLDNRAFPVYTALVSHNGLVRQKGSCTGSVSPTGQARKVCEKRRTSSGGYGSIYVRLLKFDP